MGQALGAVHRRRSDGYRACSIVAAHRASGASGALASPEHSRSIRAGAGGREDTTRAAGADLEVDDSTAAIPHSTTNSPGEAATANTAGTATNGSRVLETEALMRFHVDNAFEVGTDTVVDHFLAFTGRAGRPEA